MFVVSIENVVSPCHLFSVLPVDCVCCCDGCICSLHSCHNQSFASSRKSLTDSVTHLRENYGYLMFGWFLAL